MARIKFITDSASDIPKELQQQYSIHVLPFMIAMGDKEYRDNEDFTPYEFYAAMTAQKEIPTHSQLTPFTFGEQFALAYDEGYSDVIYTSINAKGSATNQNAVMAKAAFFDEHPEAADKFAIHIIDGTCYTMGYGYASVLGARAAQAGKGIDEILTVMQDWIANEMILFVPYDLKFVKKSGRVSAAAAFLGDALGLKPIITFENGESKILTKVRGEKSVIPTIIDMMKKQMEPGSQYLCIHGSLPDRNTEIVRDCTDGLGYAPEIVYPLGCVIAINSGPNVVGVVFHKKK